MAPFLQNQFKLKRELYMASSNILKTTGISKKVDGENNILKTGKKGNNFSKEIDNLNVDDEKQVKKDGAAHTEHVSHTEHNEKSESLNIKIHTIPTLKLLKVKIPMDYINVINDHIDNVIIPNNKSFANGLVGQINQDKKSAQLDFPFDTEFGKEFQNFLEMCGTTYLLRGHGRKSIAEPFQCWTIHSYAGDYNPFHSHCVQTRAGLSCVIYLKVPECIEQNDNEQSMIKLTEATGQCDGWKTAKGMPIHVKSAYYYNLLLEKHNLGFLICNLLYLDSECL